MIRSEIDIEKNEMPAWAQNYLSKNKLLDTIQMIKKSKRREALPEVLAAMNLQKHLDAIYFNAKGNVVFKWKTAKDRTIFLLQWS